MAGVRAARLRRVACPDQGDLRAGGTDAPRGKRGPGRGAFRSPVLDLLGHAWTPQAGYSTAAGRSVPDYALFLSDEGRLKAAQLEKNSLDRFRDAAALAEAKEFERPFSTRRGGRLNEDPHAQILRYLYETRVGWGILTNGRFWRLYSYERATQGQFHEVDLVALLERGDERDFRLFVGFFSRTALEPDEQGRCLLDRMLDEAERSAVAVGDALERQVFDAVPLLATGLLGDEGRTQASLAAAFENSLVFLYRMLFCLQAESRGLLPVDNPHYCVPRTSTRSGGCSKSWGGLPGGLALIPTPARFAIDSPKNAPQVSRSSRNCTAISRVRRPRRTASSMRSTGS